MDYNPYRYVQEHRNGCKIIIIPTKWLCAYKRRVIAGDGHETRDLKYKAIYALWYGIGRTVLTMTITCGNGHDIIGNTSVYCKLRGCD